ncbi:MAG TPA: hypothetical protein VHN78_08335 [Chloroflexota bacterium]|nr:hypothetical protein [Chloroflexota bacterium]
MNGALAGAVGAAIWAAQQPLDKRFFRCGYDDVALLGKLVPRGDGWPAAGLALHLQNGAMLGVAYARVRPLLPGPPVASGAAAALLEHIGLWPLVRLSDRLHPAREELSSLSGNRRAFMQATWRHLLFGAVLGGLEGRLNGEARVEPTAVPVSSDGHGDIETAVGVPART